MAKTFTLPSNVEAERVVLGAMMMNKAALAIALGSLSEKSFSGVDMRNVYVFRACQELSDHGVPVDPTTVTNELISLKLAEDSGGPDYLFSLIDSSIVPENVDHYIKIVKEQAVLRDLLLTMKDIENEYAGQSIPDVGDFVMQASDRVAAVAASRSVGDFKSSKEVAETVRIRLNQESSANRDGLTGVTTGYRKLNLMVHGWQPGDLIILAARPGMGKTALLLNLAYNAAAREGRSVAFFSLEMASSQLMQRLISNRSCVPNDKIQTGMLSSSDRVKIASAIDDISKTPLYFDDTPDSMLGDIIAKATKLKAAHNDLCLLCIDYIGRIRTAGGGGKNDSRQQEVSLISGSLKTLARQLKIPVIVACQLNRNVEDTDSKVPQLSNLRESGSIEQDADQVLLLYRKDYYTDVGQKVGKRGASWTKNKYEDKAEADATQLKAPEVADKSGNPSTMRILLAKNRNGQIGNFTLIFSKAYSRFDEPTEEFEAALADYEAKTGQLD